MNHRNKGKILSREKAPREMMIRNLASSVIMYEKVKTTSAKAKVAKPFVERLINNAKKGDLAARRSLIEALPQPLAVKKAMEVLGERYKTRAGGYTRIIKLGKRTGDGADMVQFELV
jgi:large subunit ribosomal protein L17